MPLIAALDGGTRSACRYSRDQRVRTNDERLFVTSTALISAYEVKDLGRASVIHQTMNLELLSKYPPTPSHPTPLLFIHGAFHGAWCWDEHFLDYFAQHGFAAHALSLRGHGATGGRQRLRWTRLAEYVADVAQVVSTLPSAPVLIGHSMGGLVVQKYLETYAAPASVLLASVPPTGALPLALRLARRHPLHFAKVNLTLSLFPLVASPNLAREAFFSPCLPTERVLRFSERLQDESYFAFLDALGLDLPRPQWVRAPRRCPPLDWMLDPSCTDAFCR